MNARVRLPYHDVPAGTQGRIVKRWRDGHGTRWVQLDFGPRLSRHGLRCLFPASCVVVLQQ